MNSSIHNEDEETDESLRPKPTKRIKLEHHVDTSSTSTTSTTKTASIAATSAVTSNEISSMDTIASTDDHNTIEQEQTQSPQRTKGTASQKTYTKQDLIDYFVSEHTKRRESYVDKLLELFFLQDNGNLPEYYTWRKKLPAPALLQYFKQVAKDDETEFENLQYDKASLDSVNANAVKITPLSQVQQLPIDVRPSSLQSLAVGASNLSTSTTSGQQQISQPQQSQSPFTTNSTSLSSSISNLSQNATSTQSPASAVAATSITSSAHSSSSTQFTSPLAVASSKSNVNNQQHHTSTSSKNVINSPFSTPTSSYHSSHKLAQLNSSYSQFSKSLPSTPIGGLSSKKSSRFHQSHSITHATSPSFGSTTPTVSNISSVYESSIGSKEQIVERAKQEAHVLQRVSELRKEGLWSARRLPRVQEPLRDKAHWDFLLEEMVWLSADFAHERKWKRINGRRCCRMVLKYHADKQSAVERAERESTQRLKKIASTISKDVRKFWSDVERLVDYKMQTKLEEKRKKALDLHLNYIVGQTEKYSSWLAEGLNKSLPHGEQSTVDKEEDSNETPSVENENKDQNVLSNLEKNDLEFNLSDDQDESDVEDTIAEQERVESHQQNAKELSDLQNEANLPIEDLLKWYTEMEEKNEGQFDESDFDEEDDEEEEDEDQDEEDETTVNESEGDQSIEENEGEKEEIGVEYLLNLDSEASEKKSSDVKTSGPSIEITDIAAGAKSIQPKGNTLSTAQIQTRVPFLLKGNLREYQLIGLDWLVQMYSENLNGVLADEMGLGKTIQTIALLAHLACEKGIWGPHLIVVPTSVMLNWEMEVKKWCPAFKVITYYGSTKERKLKRQGWTKPNTFHICITSYKLVVQDHNSFRRKKWRYLILDEAQHIKNFKSQRWQMLLNFNTQRRLLLTGTPLQNNLMELWSLMHFLMPNVFSSHRDFKDWFVNPMTGMIEGNQQMNLDLIERLHTVLRPFLLRRIKSEVEKQLPKKYEHILSCRLSKRQRFLYEEFMSLTKTKETLESGNFLSVINVLMQLRKVCNHPNLFETRSVQSSFSMKALTFSTASLATTAIAYNPFKNVDLNSLNSNLVDLCSRYSASDIHRIKSLQVPCKLIEEIDQLQLEAPPKVPIVKFNNQKQTQSGLPSLNHRSSSAVLATPPQSLRIRNSLQQNTIQNSLTETDELKKSNNTPNKQQQVSKSITTNHNLSDHSIVRNACGQQLSALEVRKDEERKEKLKLLSKLNQVKCNRHSLYTKDLLNIVDVQSDVKLFTNKQTTNFDVGQGYFTCLHNQKRERKSADYEHYSETLSNILKTPQELINQLNTHVDRFTFVVPAAAAPKIQLHVPHPSSSIRNCEQYFENKLHYELIKKSDCLHKIVSNMVVQFPELRLIQYDCGKLQQLDKLLWKLKAGGHRALIFTQMSRMLDIFEQFLNYHGHTYLRLDGSTKIDQRQALMERFNADKRIFCFILSTRSGGVGVNLTGADTVIFYDSDWNPQLDLQAQDRCHRIGQTRDVHIYRLVSEKTVEENILKKAKQKQFLNDITIEGGNFTTAFFQNNTIKELFNVNTSSFGDQNIGDQDLLQPTKVLIEEVVEDEKTTKMNTQIGQALHSVEEESDVFAAKTAIAEASAELAEFDESIPLDVDKNEEKSPEEEELERVVNELKPVERWAIQFLENIHEPMQAEQLKQAEEEIEAQKKTWELGHLKSLQEENDRALKQQEPDEILTMSKEELSQAYVSRINEEIMPTWTPPTPPQDENDYYYDYSLALMYEPEIMTESQLPPVYVPKESKRVRLENISNRKQTKLRKDENINIPRSLFDKPSPFILKLRKEVKSQKLRGLILGGPDINQLQRISTNFGSNHTLPQPPTLQQQAALSKAPNLILHGTQQESQIYWSINEDWALVEIIQQIQELPINLLVLSPGHIPNWDFVSSHVNSKTSTYRSAKLCRHHYETVILPKEEGRGTEQPSKKVKKQQKQAALQAANQQNQLNGTTVSAADPAISVKPPIRPVKISNLFQQDNNASFTQLMNSRFNNILQIANKRQPTLKPVFINQAGKNPKHLMLLQDSQINYDAPLLPTSVAQNRTDRILREQRAKTLALEQQQAAKQKLIQMSQQRQQQLIQCQPAQNKNVISLQRTVLSSLPQPTITQVVPANTATINVTQQATQMQTNTGNVVIATSGQQQQQTVTNQQQFQQAQFQATKINPAFNQSPSITVSKANVQQFVATPTNISGLTPNQQISNLAKALSQAAANFQPSQNATIQVQSSVAQVQQQNNNAVAISQPQLMGAQIMQSSNVQIQPQTPRIASANISINQEGLSKIVSQATPVSITQSTSQTGDIRIASSIPTSTSTPAGTVLSVTSIQPQQQKIVSINHRLSQAQLNACRQTLFVRQQLNANKPAGTTQQIRIPTTTVQQTSALQAQLTSQSTSGQIALPVSGTVVSGQQTVATSAQHLLTAQGATRVQIATATNTGNVIQQPVQQLTSQQTIVGTGTTIVGTGTTIVSSQQTSSQPISTVSTPMNAQNIVRPSVSGQTIISNSTALPIVPISSSAPGQSTKISDIQILQARSPRVQATIQQPTSQQIQIASLAKPVSTTVMSAGLPSMAVPIGTVASQHQKILTTTRSPQLYARKPTEEELEQFRSNRNAVVAAKGQPANIVTSATVVQQATSVSGGAGNVMSQQPATISATTSQATSQTGSIQLPQLAQVQFLHIQPPLTNQQNPQISKEGTSTNAPSTAYLIYTNPPKTNTK